MEKTQGSGQSENPKSPGTFEQLIEPIMKRWLERVQAELPEARKSEIAVVYDTLPTFLTQLVQTLSMLQPRIATGSTISAEQTAKLGMLPLSLFLSQFELLRECTREVLESNVDLGVQDRDIVLKSIDLSIAASTAAFIHNKMLQEAAEQEFLGRTEETTSRIIDAPNLMSAIGLLLDSIRDLVAASGTVALPLNLKTNKFDKGIASSSLGAHSTEIIDALAASPFARQVLAADAPLQVINIWSLEPELAELLRGNAIGSIMGFKFKSGPMATALLFAAFRGVRDFTPLELKRLEVFNQRISMALELIRLRETMQSLLFESRAASQKLTAERDEMIKERDRREYFVATVTHDLRSPLAAIRMGAELMGRAAGKPELRRNVSAKIIESTIRADKMIRDLLDASQIRAGQRLTLQMSSCDLREIALEVARELTDRYGNRFVVDAESPVVGDWAGDQLLRAIENLGSNAAKYGDPDAPITISVNDRHEEVDVRVNNKGATLSEQDQLVIFQPFARTPSALAGGKTGWGLGLTLVKGIVEAHDGTVRVESTPDRGTTFTITIPRKARAQAA